MGTFRESDVAIGDGPGALHGSLLHAGSPSVREPVLILPGSGPTDRNGNSPAGITAQPYRLLALGLAAQGVTSFRVDKRGVGASAAAGSSESGITIGTFAADARNQARELRSLTGARCVWLLGHSEGSLHALLAAQDNDRICGLILVSPVGRKMGDILREQLIANPANAPVIDEASRIIASLEAGRPVSGDSMDPALLPLFRPAIQPFLISILAVDPPSLLRSFKGPVMVVQGTTDLQTTPDDAERLARARAGVRLEIIDGMNHVLKDAPADRTANIAAYSDPDRPLSATLVPLVFGFIRKHSRQ